MKGEETKEQTGNQELERQAIQPTWNHIHNTFLLVMIYYNLKKNYRNKKSTL